MSKGRQTKTLARITLTASVVDIHGQQVLVWGLTKPHDWRAEKPSAMTTHPGNMQAGVVELVEWVAKHFPGLETK